MFESTLFQTIVLAFITIPNVCYAECCVHPAYNIIHTCEPVGSDFSGGKNLDDYVYSFNFYLQGLENVNKICATRFCEDGKKFLPNRHCGENCNIVSATFFGCGCDRCLKKDKSYEESAREWAIENGYIYLCQKERHEGEKGFQISCESIENLDHSLETAYHPYAFMV